MPKKRNYAQESRQHKQPAVAARHRERMKDRYDAQKVGRVSKHDGMELDHMNPSGKKGSLGSKTQVLTRSANRRKGHPK